MSCMPAVDRCLPVLVDQCSRRFLWRVLQDVCISTTHYAILLTTCVINIPPGKLAGPCKDWPAWFSKAKSPGKWDGLCQNSPLLKIKPCSFHCHPRSWTPKFASLFPTFRGLLVQPTRGQPQHCNPDPNFRDDLDPTFRFSRAEARHKVLIQNPWSVWIGCFWKFIPLSL